ncbi:MAG: mechanosensitive ion channel family protein [Blastocatellia bacterium]|nr:mechanosensitive ion channel family protein [Blastocatellia bacterium]
MQELLQQWVFNPTVGKLAVALFGLILVAIVVRIVKESFSVYLKDNEVRYRVRKFINFVGYLAGLMVLATVYSDKLGGLTVVLGVAGAGIAFALQEVVASVAGWFAISFAGFYNTGDRVQLGGIKGDVIDIGILRTTLMEVGEWVKGDLYSGRVVRIANSFVFKEPVFNYSGDFPFLWDEITVPVKYGCDHRLARAILESVTQETVGEYVEQADLAWQGMLKQYLIEDTTVSPLVTLVATDNWMEFTVRYVVDFKKRRGTKDRLFTRILDEFEKTNHRVQIASMTVHLVETPVLQVRIAEKKEN